MFTTIILRSVVILVLSLFCLNVDKPGNTGVIYITIKGSMTNYLKSRYIAVLK